MNTADRKRAQAQVERACAGLVKKGWRIEELSVTDRHSEPFTVTVVLSIEELGVTPGKGVL